MALTKRVYTDGETIITAQNLNDIQDEIISQGNTLVPKTRTINSKALSSNITLAAADVGAVPTTRTVNSKALSSNITLTSDDIGYNSSTTYTSGSVGKAVSDLNGAITSLGSDDIANDSTNVSGSKVTDALDTLNGALNQLTYVIQTPNNVECTANQYVTLATLNLTKGAWAFFATHAFTSGYAELYQDYIDDSAGTQLALVRNISMDSGGGTTISGFYVAAANTTINYRTYQRHTGTTVTANRIRFAAVKIHD